MEILLLVLRLTLAAVFGVAGIAKLFDPAGSERAFSDFGLPKGLARPMTTLLPAIELLIAGALLFVSTGWLGAIGATVVLALFIAAMLYQYSKGNTPDCHCFGQLHSEPVGPASIMRNILLLAISFFLVLQGRFAQGLALVSSSQEILPFVTGISVIILLFAAVLYLKRISEQQNQIIRRIEVMELVAREGGLVERDEAGLPHEGLPIGAVVPDFELPSIKGELVALGQIRQARMPVLFLFVSPTCNPCKGLVPEFDSWQTELKEKVRLVFISSGTPEENEEKFAGRFAKQILLQNGREISELLRAKWTPSAILMDADGRVASHIAAGDNAIRDLVSKISSENLNGEFTYFANGNSTHYKIKIGESVPDISVTDLAGKPIDKDYFKGKQTLVTFWSTACPHCGNMLDELREWDRTKGIDDPKLLLFSDGDEAEHQSFGLNSPVILDKGHKTAAGFGMFGTPSAVLINEDGRFISETAIGAADIWLLVGKRN
jgi:peroxiredoxin/uncharacterized membrane protein YphA (DoxX/SURF4 family)